MQTAPFTLCGTTDLPHAQVRGAPRVMIQG